MDVQTCKIFLLMNVSFTDKKNKDNLYCISSQVINS